ncbi:hypothetical protein R3W88_033533 [Solanum pinnatisectum]|uniref:Uncharacterized protein n=1 Tax=Solanum pinnatisectum TaxID=50273 RepID=A0AAV9K0U7_9SOLN|nr:hypothetical protein R3W88_033533 [Solanum pinnatisectum]
MEVMEKEAPNWGISNTNSPTAAGLQCPFPHPKDTMFKWWNSTCSVKLRPLFNDKRRNMIRHGGKMYMEGMMMEINRNLHYLPITRYLWLRNIPDRNYSEMISIYNITKLNFVQLKIQPRIQFKIQDLTQKHNSRSDLATH